MADFDGFCLYDFDMIYMGLYMIYMGFIGFHIYFSVVYIDLY